MSQPNAEAARLWTLEGFREDEWRHADTADALLSNRRVILPLQIFLGLDPETRSSSRERLGVLLQPGEQLETIAQLLDELSLVALAAIRSGVLPGAGNRRSAHWYPWEQSWVWLAMGAVGALCAGMALLENDRALGTIGSALLGTVGVLLLVVTLAL